MNTSSSSWNPYINEFFLILNSLFPFNGLRVRDFPVHSMA